MTGVSNTTIGGNYEIIDENNWMFDVIIGIIDLHSRIFEVSNGSLI